MRLASLLPMLLLAFSVPVAAQNCQIFDLTGTVVQVNPANCQFFVSLSFQHNGTTNQYVVTGNGNLYGTFPYSQNPLILGPFNGNPNNPTVLEFQVTDAVFQDCHASVVVDFPPCGLPGLCNINDLNVLPGACDPTGLTYSLTVNFEVQNPNSNTFDVFANGVLLGNFPLAALPLQIPAFPASGNPIDVIKVCITGQVNCCETLEFPAPDCSNPPCAINDLTVHTGDCTSDSTYKATINFGLVGPVPTDSFAIWANGQFLGLYGINQLPLPVEIKWDGGLLDEVKVCLAHINVVCCRTIEFKVPACLTVPPCEIRDLVVKSDTCSSDSTFHAILNFLVNDPTAVDSFDLWANGNYMGHFGMNQLPLNLNFPWNGLVFNHVKVCTGNLPGCCKEYQFVAPSCLPFKPCKITNIFVLPGACTSDSTYKATINFNATNPGVGKFIVYSNGVLVDTFNLTAAPLMLELNWGGTAFDVIRICILESPNFPSGGCCESKEYAVPDCLLPCDISDLTVNPGDCVPGANAYKLVLNFATQHPGNDFFEVWGNGTYLGLFPLSSLPLTIPAFPANGNAIDVIKICINDQPNCCEFLEFQGPDCSSAPCEVFDLSVVPGDCDPNTNTYNVTLDFNVQNPGNALFEVWGNGTYLGLFPIASLPLVIPNVPSNGNVIDIIKVCINDHPDCCKSIEFQGPNCNTPCEIFDLTVDVGDCNQADSTYSVWVNFQVQNANSNTFGLWANGQFFGNYDLSQLPLLIPNFPWDGNGPNDVIKVCLVNNSGAPSCCRTIEYPAPDCFPNTNCSVSDLHVEVGGCTGDSTYTIIVNFQVANAPTANFALWANGQFFGMFNVNQLPLTIQDFPWNGGPTDFLKVCFTNNPTGQGACCGEIEFHVPDCLMGVCDIYDLTVTPGDCNPNNPGTYSLTFDFQVDNPGNDFFEVWVNGVNFGTHLISSLPFTIPNVPANGAPKDVIKVCINDHPNCCATLEFPGPLCNVVNNCEIFDVVLDPGDCDPTTTNYNLFLNFQVINPDNDFFEVWGNGVYLGAFPLAGLPIVLQNFPSNGPAVDVIKICIKNHPDCCKIVDFQGPDCGPLNCDIFDLTVDTGNCTGDSTYQVKVNFQVVNPPGALFQVWANGQLYGVFNLNQLPLAIQDFPWNGGNNDVIKICLLPVQGTPQCCIVKEFPVPGCLLNNNDCHIWDLNVLHTPCLCGQFFAVLTFNHNNGGAGGFDILGNGNNYGNFPYDTVQPIILGPFVGDGTTMYEFVVVDHDHPNVCFDGFNLGKVECMTPVVDPSHGTAMLTLSPNPTSNWLNVTAMLANGAALGQTNVEVYATDGRLVQTNTVSNGANFQLDVSSLPSGVYRIVLMTDSGRLEGTFAKQY